MGCILNCLCLFSMALKGFRQPLVQEDMWDLNEIDSTSYIDQRFQHHIQKELAKARVRYQQQKSKNKGNAQEEGVRNGVSAGLGKDINQDVLLMVRSSTPLSLISLFTISVFSKQSTF